VVNATCTTPCQLGVSGYVTIRRRRLPLISVSRSVTAGPHRFRINLSRRNRAVLLRTIKAHRTAEALLTISAALPGAPAEGTSAEAQIQLRR
jgi:hypothetical protein